MSRYLLRSAAAGAAALLAGLLTAPSASADIQTFPDVGEHITGVRVSHGPSTVGVTAYDADMTLRTYYHFWLDTNSSDPGPEYKAIVYPDSDGNILFKAANFDSGGITMNCSGAHAIADTDGPEYAKIFVPRSCIGTPSRIRVTVVGYYDKDLDNDIDVVDWAPGERRTYAWVNR